MSYKKQIEELVNKGADNIKKKTITINDDKPIFAKEDFEVVEGQPKYFGTDKYGRATGAIALISKNTLPRITEKKLEYPRPYGWTKNLEKTKGLFESCHIIAYNLSAQTTDKENLFIGTNDLNTSMMKNIENDINNYVKNNDFNVLYKVTMQYREKEQIPIGILIEAQSIGGEKNICKFCYNIEKYIKFDYADGTIIYNHDYLNKVKDKVESIKEKILSTTKQSKTKKLTSGQKRNFVLNIATNECHYNKDCEELKNVDPKYIQGTRTTEQAIIHNEFVFCDKCK